MIMIKGILIDIDNTLYDYGKSHSLAINAAEDAVKSFVNIDKFKKAYKEARDYVHRNLEFTASSHNRLLYFQKTLELLNINDYLYAKKLYDIYWNTFLDNMELYDGVEDFLKLFDRSRVCFVTDLTAYIQYRKIEKTKLDLYVGNIVTSEEAGVEKPNRKIFELALQKLNLLPCEVLMIGDSYERDYLGAKAAGIKALLYDKNNSNADIQADSFSNYYKLKEEITCLMK